MSGGHAPMPPSSAPVWGHCSGYLDVLPTVIDHETEENRQGDAAHEVVANVLRAFQSEAFTTDLHAREFIGRQTSNGVVVDEQIAEGAQQMVELCLHIVGRANSVVSNMQVEQRVEMPRIHPQNYGTPDFGLVVPGAIHCADYKHGHLPVHAKGNLQLIDYVEGLAYQHQVTDPTTRVVIYICRPFQYNAGGPVDVWETTLGELQPYFEQLHRKAHESPRTLTTGPHCRNCEARVRCAARQQADYCYIDVVEHAFLMHDMSDRDLAVEYDILKNGVSAMRSRLDALEDELKHRISQGAEGTGKTLEAGRPGHSKWTCGTEVVNALAAQFGIDARKKDPITPVQFVQAVPAKLRPIAEQAVGGISKRSAGALKLINAEDSITYRAFAKRN